MPEKTVLYTRDENVGIIKLNRPKRLNAITVDLLRDFIEQLAAARQDESVAVIVIYRNGNESKPYIIKNK